VKFLGMLLFEVCVDGSIPTMPKLHWPSWKEAYNGYWIARRNYKTQRFYDEARRAEFAPYNDAVKFYDKLRNAR